MTMPPCFELLNDNWFESVIGQINSVTTPVELQNLVNQVYGDVALLNSAIEGQLALLGPIEALLTAPTNPTEVITWITGMIQVLTNMYAPFLKFTEQLTALAGQVTAMTAAIEAVASLKNWSITIPPVDPFCSL